MEITQIMTAITIATGYIWAIWNVIMLRTNTYTLWLAVVLLMFAMRTIIGPALQDKLNNFTNDVLSKDDDEHGGD